MKFAYPEGHESLPLQAKVEYTLKPDTKAGRHSFWLDILGELVTADGQAVGVNYAGASGVDQYFAIARAEALLVTWAGGGFIPLVQAANDLGVTDEIPLAAGFVDNPTMPAFFADAIGTTSGILYHYTLADNPINDWLVEQTTERFATPPDLFDADAMNAAIVLSVVGDGIPMIYNGQEAGNPKRLAFFERVVQVG